MTIIDCDSCKNREKMRCSLSVKTYRKGDTSAGEADEIMIDCTGHLTREGKKTTKYHVTHYKRETVIHGLKKPKKS